MNFGFCALSLSLGLYQHFYQGHNLIATMNSLNIMKVNVMKLIDF